jgi:Flp pilus assembly protein TadG
MLPGNRDPIKLRTSGSASRGAMGGIGRLLRSSLRRHPISAEDSGAAAVELAVVVLPLIVLMLATFDYATTAYEITSLEGATRAVAEYARVNCTVPLTGTCTTNIASLVTAMESTNNSLSGATITPTAYCTCVNNSLVSCNPGSCASASDPRIIQYIQITATQGRAKLFSWDPWDTSTHKLTARMSTRVQ